MALEISLFGKFQVRRAGQSLAGLDAPKVQQMLSYLLLYRERPHPREALAHVLWDGDHTDQPGKRLRKTLWQLRNALAPPPGSPEEPLLCVESEWIQINDRAELWLDTRCFEQAAVQAYGLQGGALDAARAQALRQAVDLYRGGLQESWYQDWYLYERERFRHSYLVLLDKLMAYCEAQQRYEEGLTYGALILRCDPSSERTHRRLMRLYYLAGDRTQALRQYARCAQALEQELGVRPARSTLTLYQRLRADHPPASPLPSPAPVEASSPPAAADPSPLPEVLERLLRVEQALVSLEQEVDLGIQSVRVLLNGM
jgi:DNA-binding SARP family transcriptional activator